MDKTAQIHRWVREHKIQLFLARPRRFGKSLLISTLKAIFQGRRELFKGLAIERLDFDWKTYPVLHLDMGSCVGKNREETEARINDQLQMIAESYDIKLKKTEADRAFMELIQALYDIHGKVVVLVDEYDKPLLGHLGKPMVLDIQELLKGFYGVIKTTEPKQRFAFITGVSKFSKVSIFSDLNNLTDLTMDSKAATLLGYTQEELEDCFDEHIDALGHSQGWGRQKTLEDLKFWYNGYRFHGASDTVYNPVSTMKCLDHGEFKNYWFETGTPTFLVELLKRSPLDMSDLSAPESLFSVYDVEALSPLPLLVQTGYLTIKGTKVRGRETKYNLGYPNYEIENSFSTWLSQGLTGMSPEDLPNGLERMTDALEAGDMDTMLEELKVFFANVPYTITLKNEKYYQTIFFVVFKLIGAYIETEICTNRGRIDAVVQTADHIFVMEFKLHDSAENALKQIRETDYALKYQKDEKKIILVGVGFDSETRNLGDWLVESV